MGPKGEDENKCSIGRHSSWVMKNKHCLTEWVGIMWKHFFLITSTRLPVEKIHFQEEIKTTDGWLCKATASKILRKSTKKAAWEVGQGLEDSAGSWKDYKGDDSKTQIETQRCNMWRVEGKLEGQ